MSRPRLDTERGFSLVEVVTVVAITGVLIGMAVIQMEAARPSIRGDSGMRAVLGQIHMARERAITERRFMRIVFTPATLIEVVREEVPGPGTTTVSSTVLEGSVELRHLDDLPDTPDHFHGTGAVNFGLAQVVKFTPDGQLVDENGNQVNGTIFLALPGEWRSARGITILGSTGRIRAYRWDGANWKLV
jgi:prepilin-type N-terminal cleavage/methylation domain-containing protein